MKRLLGVLGLVALSQPAFAQTVIDSDFRLKINEGQAGEVIESSTLIPLMDGACYEWRLMLAKTKGEVEVTEVFTLPSAPAGWGDVGENVAISDDLLTATSTMNLVAADGWIGHGWCVAEGDPTGDYSIEVRSGDRVLGTFPFVVEAM